MHDALSKGPADADWNRLAPLLEEAVDQLGESDRVAVWLRFIERRTFGEIGSTLRLSEDGARKRVDRALEKLRLILSRSGVSSSAAALAGALTTHAVTAAPSGLAASVVGTALAGAAAGNSALSFLAFMSMTKIQASVAAGVVLAATLGVVSLKTKNDRLEREAAELRWQNEETARSQNGNLRVVTGRLATENPAALSADIGPAGGSAVAPTDTAPRSPEAMRPIGTLQNRGRATPEAAWETLFWALQARDYRMLAQVMALEPADQRLVETLWARVPEVRAQGRIANAEELFAVTWGNHNRSRFFSLRIAKATTFDADYAEVVSEGQRREAQGADKTVMDFRRTADGWKWVVPTVQAEHTVGEAMHDLRDFLKPAP
jgi:hypothetical protein